MGKLRMRKLKIYLDTSVISALFDTKSPEMMRWTEDFWTVINNYEVYISDVVIAEILETPDIRLKEQMGEVMKSLIRLKMDEDAETLSSEYVRYGAVPSRYRKDAMHIAITTVNHIEILVSWNYRHIVRRKTKEVVRMVNSMNNYPFIEIVTPPELLGGE